MAWCADIPGGCEVRVRLVPRARRSEIAAVNEDHLRIRVQAPPVDGKANRELVRWLAQQAGVPKSSVRLAAGRASRNKRLTIAGVTAPELAARLTPDPDRN